MEKYVNKDEVVAEIKRRKFELYLKIAELGAFESERIGLFQEEDLYDGILSFLDTLETKDVDTWHLQEKEDIYDAVKDWGLHTFACVMKDGTIQKFSGIMDEDYEGHIGVNIDGVNDDYDNVDDIVKWIEIT